MYLIDKQNNLSLTLRHFFHHTFQPLFKLTLVFCSRDQLPHIQCIDDLALQIFRYVAVHDPHRKALSNRRFTHTGFTHKNRIVFGPSGEYVQSAPDLFISSDHWIEFALPCHLIQVTRIFIKRVELRLLGL